MASHSHPPPSLSSSSASDSSFSALSSRPLVLPLLPSPLALGLASLPSALQSLVREFLGCYSLLTCRARAGGLPTADPHHRSSAYDFSVTAHWTEEEVVKDVFRGREEHRRSAAVRMGASVETVEGSAGQLCPRLIDDRRDGPSAALLSCVHARVQRGPWKALRDEDFPLLLWCHSRVTSAMLRFPNEEKLRGWLVNSASSRPRAGEDEYAAFEEAERKCVDELLQEEVAFGEAQKDSGRLNVRRVFRSACRVEHHSPELRQALREDRQRHLDLHRQQWALHKAKRGSDA